MSFLRSCYNKWNNPTSCLLSFMGWITSTFFTTVIQPYFENLCVIHSSLQDNWSKRVHSDNWWNLEPLEFIQCVWSVDVPIKNQLIFYRPSKSGVCESSVSIGKGKGWITRNLLYDCPSFSVIRSFLVKEGTVPGQCYSLSVQSFILWGSRRKAIPLLSRSSLAVILFTN